MKSGLIKRSWRTSTRSLRSRVRTIFCSTLSDVARVLTEIFFGAFKNSLQSCSISGDMVAEKKNVCRVFGTSLRMNRISSMNPISSIRSASSKTILWKSSVTIFPRLIKSVTRPGVPITICTPLSSSRICLPIGAPPTHETEKSFVP